MTDPHLPEDHRRWPSDPFDLLGVTPDADEIALRRAYSRLIRQFKPEQSPAEFQKIRAAYEQARLRVQWRHVEFHVDPVENAADSTPDAPLPTPEPRAPFVDRVRNAWAHAEGGDWRLAARELQDLHYQQPESDEIAARLYWIRRLQPPSDGDTPVDRGVSQSPIVRAQAIHAFRESFSAAYSDAADAWWTASIPVWEKLDFLRARWSAAVRANAFDRIANDLDPAREMLKDSRSAWFQAVVLAIEISYLSTQQVSINFRVRARTLSRELKDLELSHAHLLDRLDIIESIAHNAPPPNAVPQHAGFQLALQAMLPEVVDFRQAIADEVVQWQRRPHTALERLDNLAAVQAAVPYAIHQGVERYAAERSFYADPHEPDDLARFLRVDRILIPSINRLFTHPGVEDGVAHVRGRLLDFCLRERVRLESVVRALREKVLPDHDLSREFTAALDGDAALSAVVTGCLAFWN